MISETSDRQDPKEDKNENEKENLITMFKRIHKFETNTEIEIRVTRLLNHIDTIPHYTYLVISSLQHNGNLCF